MDIKPEPSAAPDAMIAAMIDNARAVIGGAVPEADGGPYSASSADETVTAEVSADGRVTALTLDPTLARRPLEDIAAEVVATVNAALDARPARPTVGPLLDRLREVQEDSVHRMGQISQAFSDALAKAGRA